MDEVAANISQRLIVQGMPWFEHLTDLDNAFNEVEIERDCYAKFRAAKYFAVHLELPKKIELYSDLLMTEEKELRAKGYLD